LEEVPLSRSFLSLALPIALAAMGIPSLGILELALVATVALGFLVFFLLFFPALAA
jgi:hypothetical protein